MAAEYTKVFTNPYPDGWKNLPSTSTPIIAQALQQHTNAIMALENFLNSNPIPEKLSELLDDAIPTKLSQLQNDVGYITASSIPAIPTKLSQLQNDTNFITQEDVEIPENLSDYTNDVGFVTDATNNLLNYYKKTEVYSKSEIDQLIAAIPKGLDIQVVNSLPTENISDTTIYLVPKELDNVELANNHVLNMENASNNEIININSNRVIDTSSVFPIGDQVTSEQEVGDPCNVNS